jgi:hypothetical protein
MRIAVGKYLECDGKKGIARQHCGCLIKDDMRRWPPPAKVVVVHAREIVMDQGISMQRFHRSANTQSASGIDIEQRRRAQD